MYGSALPEWLAPPRILIGLPGPTEKLTNSAAIDAAEHEATKPDNRAKLGAYEGANGIRSRGMRRLTASRRLVSGCTSRLQRELTLPGEISRI